MKLKRIIAFILCTVMITGIAPLILIDIKASAAETIAEYARYTASGTPAIEDGIYIITHDGSTNGTQTSNTTTEIMDITTAPQSGRLGEVANVTITNDKIQTSRAYELNFKRSGSTGNTYYITNNEGKYLTVSSSSLSFGTSQTALTASVDNNVNVSIYRNNYRINHSSNYFSTQRSSSTSASNRLRLFKYAKDVSGSNAFRAETQIRTSTDLYYTTNDLLREKGTSLRWTPVVITVTVNELPVPEDEENVMFIEQLVGFFKYLIDIFRQLVKIFTVWSL